MLAGFILVCREKSCYPWRMNPEQPELTYRKIAVFWLPLYSTWLMMSMEGPFIAAIIARLAGAKFNLAAYGVAFSLGMIFESPIIMMLSAANVLVKDRVNFLKLRRFSNTLNVLITLAMLVVLLPPVFFWLTRGLIGLPWNVARLTHLASILLIPWPAAIGYRRFYQGILIGNNLPHRVAYGTLVRLSFMAATALLLYLFSTLPGAYVGAAALSAGVVMEAVASRFMARKLVRKLLNEPEKNAEEKKAPSYRSLSRFYFPLAMTSVLALAIYPLITFFMGQSRLPIESLAVLPVINALTFIFRSAGLSFQEAAITLLGGNAEHYRPLRSFALLLGGTASLLLGLLSFTPAAILWFHHISGLTLELTRLAILPIRILSILPALEVLLALQRSLLIKAKNTRPVTMATAIEVTVIAGMLFLAIFLGHMVGVLAAALAAVCGRLCANFYLQRCDSLMKRKLLFSGSFNAASVNHQ
jgi:O-antigen/teichoic acid export membrane protein